jgi:hypothetical protein
MSAIAIAARRWLTFALTLLVIAKMQHCMWEEGREMRQQFEVAASRDAGHSAPVEPKRHDCDQESGCMCRGATLAMGVDVSHFQAQEMARLPADFAQAPLGWSVDLFAEVAADEALDHLFTSPPISGRQLRALYASLVI